MTKCNQRITRTSVNYRRGLSILGLMTLFLANIALGQTGKSHPKYTAHNQKILKLRGLAEGDHNFGRAFSNTLNRKVHSEDEAHNILEYMFDKGQTEGINVEPLGHHSSITVGSDQLAVPSSITDPHSPRHATPTPTPTPTPTEIRSTEFIAMHGHLTPSFEGSKRSKELVITPSILNKASVPLNVGEILKTLETDKSMLGGLLKGAAETALDAVSKPEADFASNEVQDLLANVIITHRLFMAEENTLGQ